MFLLRSNNLTRSTQDISLTVSHSYKRHRFLAAIKPAYPTQLAGLATLNRAYMCNVPREAVLYIL